MHVMLQKVLLKYAFNDMRSRKEDTSYFDAELINYLLCEEDASPKSYVSVYGGLAVNVSPMPDFMTGNVKLRWCKNPQFFENSTVRNVDYETGQIYLNDDIRMQRFDEMAFSYAFRFNSAQFVLVCWKKNSTRINEDNIIIDNQYPYTRFLPNRNLVKLSLCTNEVNYHHFEMLYVSWDGLFEVTEMRQLAMKDNREYHTFMDQMKRAWLEEEKKLAEEHPRK